MAKTLSHKIVSDRRGSFSGEPPPRLSVPCDIDVREIRAHLAMTQERFAATFGFPVASVRDWEQGRVRPGTSARAYLMVIARIPGQVEAALHPRGP